MSEQFYKFNQRVFLRRDPSQFGRIGCGGYGDVFDKETRIQLVFWEHEGADIVTPELVDDLMGEEELRERRRHFISALRRPEMRLLRLALRHLDWDQGIDWQSIQSLRPEYYADDRCWMLTTDKYIIVCLDPHNPKLTYEGFYLLYLHEEGNQACKCEICALEKLAS